MQDQLTAVNKAETLFHIMLKHAYLANIIKSVEPYSQEQKLQTIKDILSLFTKNFKVIYRLRKEPIDKTCLICRLILPKAKQTQADHIHVCRRKKYIAIVKARKGLRKAGSV